MPYDLFINYSRRINDCDHHHRDREFANAKCAILERPIERKDTMNAVRAHGAGSALSSLNRPKELRKVRCLHFGVSILVAPIFTLASVRFRFTQQRTLGQRSLSISL